MPHDDLLYNIVIGGMSLVFLGVVLAVLGWLAWFELRRWSAWLWRRDATLLELEQLARRSDWP